MRRHITNGHTGIFAFEAETVVEKPAAADSTDPVVRSVYSAYPLPIDAYAGGRWRGILVVEEVETGDYPRRMFAANSLIWRDLPLALKWQPKEVAEHEESVIVARIETITRDGKFIRAEGTFDTTGEQGQEAHRLVHGGFLRGLSVTIDDVTDNDVELIWPQPATEQGEEGEILAMLAEPEKVIFHHARILDTLLTSSPAMQEAYLELVPDNELAIPEAPVAQFSSRRFAAVPAHSTGAIDTAWDPDAQTSRLPDVLPLDLVNAMYAWFNGEEADNGQVPKSSCILPHHNMGEDGLVAEANITGVSSAIGVLNGSRGGVDIPEEDRQAVYDHLAQHLREAGHEAPPLASSEDAQALRSLSAAAVVMNPPMAWFLDPKLREPTPFSVDDNGRVFGHLATWNTCHTSFMGQCITPPRESELAYFTTGELVTREGQRVPVGKLTFGTNHAPGTFGHRPAVEHYEHTGYVAADVAAGVDKIGIWVAGAARPDLNTGQLRALRAAAPSGDWRRIGGKLRLVGALMVNVPGYPVPRTRTYIHDGVQTALVASGVLTEAPFKPQVPNAAAVVERIAKSIGRGHDMRMAQLKSRVHGR